jgi:hypothetical protein
LAIQASRTPASMSATSECAPMPAGQRKVSPRAGKAAKTQLTRLRIPVIVNAPFGAS